MASFLLKMNKEAENSPSTPKTFLSRTANPLEVLNFSFILPKISSPLLCFYLVIFFIHRYNMFWGTSNTTHVELTSASSESELWHSYISILTSIISFFLLQFLGLYLFKLDLFEGKVATLLTLVFPAPDTRWGPWVIFWNEGMQISRIGKSCVFSESCCPFCHVLHLWVQGATHLWLVDIQLHVALSSHLPQPARHTSFLVEYLESCHPNACLVFHMPLERSY